MKRCAVALSLIALLPTLALGQRAGGFGRGGRAPSIAREPGVEILRPVNMVNLLVERRQEVALSDSQFKQVIVLKRALDSTNAPQMRKLDSVSRLFRGGTPIFSEPSAIRRDSLTEARGVVQNAVAIVDDNNSAARDQAYALLDPQQLTKAKAIQATAERALEESRKKKP